MKSRSTLYSRYFTYIKPVSKIPIIRNYGSTIFTLLVMSILIFFAIKPTVETILVLQKKLADQEEILKKINQKTNDLSLGKKNYDEMDPVVKDKISSWIPGTVNIRSVIQTLEQSAKQHEASVSALQIQPFTVETKSDSVAGTLSEISFTFNTEGNYNNLVALLKNLRNTSRLLSIDSLSISKTSDGTGLIMSVSGKTYYLK